MSQTQPQSSESTQDTEQVAQTLESTDQQVEDNQPEESQDDYDPKARVSFDTPEQQRKFNDVYKQMKMSDARNKMQTDMLAKAMEKISELESRFSQTDHAEAERILTARLKEAREVGDEDKADRILQEIIDFRVESKLRPKEKPQKVIDPMSDPNVVTVVQYAEEKDSNGNLIRPWLNANHPDHRKAMSIAASVAMQSHSELGYDDLEDMLRRMDDAMKPKAKPAGNNRAPDPYRSNLTNNPAQGKMKLSPQELAAAQKLGVSPDNYLKGKKGWK